MVKDAKVVTQEMLITKIVKVLDDKKAEDIVSLNVHDLTTVTENMIIASGQAHTQLRAMMNGVLEEIKKLGVQALGVEGEQNGEWILLDLGSVLVHLMLPQVRKYYELEKLWSVRPE